MRGKKAAATILCLTALAGFFVPAARSQRMSKDDRASVLVMLENVSKDIRKYYYDPQLHGVDWEAEVAAAKSKIKNATSSSVALTQIAAVLNTLNDSHTFFIPPQRTTRHDYGFRMAMIGDRCYVAQVRPGSDAEAKGVKPGDEIVVIERLLPSRELLPKLDYQLNALSPQSAVRFGLRDPNGRGRVIIVAAKIVELDQVRNLATQSGGVDHQNMIRDLEYKRYLARIRTASLGDELLCAKIPSLSYLEQEVNGLVDRARKHQALIIDLRGNPGGAIETLRYLLGGIFEKTSRSATVKGARSSSRRSPSRGVVRASAVNWSYSWILSRVPQPRYSRASSNSRSVAW